MLFLARAGCWSSGLIQKAPTIKSCFNQDKTYVFYCASAWRSALSAQVAQQMGLSPVTHIAGGFTAWQKAAAPIEPVEKK